MATATGQTRAERAQALLESYPELSFYYGLSFSELWQMPRPVKQVYIDALPRLIARQEQMMITAASYPNYKAEEQRRIGRRLKRAIGGDETEVALPAVTREQHAQRAAAIGIGMERQAADA